jgi:hypothetical protein
MILTAKNSHTGHCTHTEGSAGVKVKVKVKQSHYSPEGYSRLRLLDFKRIGT